MKMKQDDDSQCENQIDNFFFIFFDYDFHSLFRSLNIAVWIFNIANTGF